MFNEKGAFNQDKNYLLRTLSSYYLGSIISEEGSRKISETYPPTKKKQNSHTHKKMNQFRTSFAYQLTSACKQTCIWYSQYCPDLLEDELGPDWATADWAHGKESQSCLASAHNGTGPRQWVYAGALEPNSAVTGYSWNRPFSVTDTGDWDN